MLHSLSRIRRSSQEEASEIAAALWISHTYQKNNKKKTPGFLSNPISQLPSTIGEAEDDKDCLPFRLSFKLWVSNYVYKSVKVLRRRILIKFLILTV